MDLDLVRHLSEAQIALVPPVSVKGRSLHWVLGRSQTYYPEHILVYGYGKTCYSLVMSFGSLQTDFQGGFWVEVQAPL